MTVEVLYRIDPSRNMQRYYRLDIECDLFGAWCVVREWGRVGRSGRIQQSAYSDKVQAIAALVRIKAAKKRRGYSAKDQAAEPQDDL